MIVHGHTTAGINHSFLTRPSELFVTISVQKQSLLYLTLQNSQSWTKMDFISLHRFCWIRYAALQHCFSKTAYRRLSGTVSMSLSIGKINYFAEEEIRMKCKRPIKPYLLPHLQVLQKRNRKNTWLFLFSEENPRTLTVIQTLRQNCQVQLLLERFREHLSLSMPAE